ncbi:hypothetical protein SUGI_0391590 [Cryptomeria japonica]|nr:hypothetical protein SUGI_0391590 [Cryptomeria japonica]
MICEGKGKGEAGNQEGSGWHETRKSRKKKRAEKRISNGRGGTVEGQSKKAEAEQKEATKFLFKALL